MNKIRRLYNQNSKGIWVLIIIIASFIVFIQLLNLWAKKNNENSTTNQANNTSSIKTSNNVTVDSSKSGVTGDTINNEKLTNDTESIEKFLNYCSNGDIDEAYDLLSQDCKDEMYETVDKFKEYYYNDNFKDGNVNFNIENWVNDTYKVKMTGDIMSTGKYDEKETSKQDYITIIDENGNYKLNINNYIGRTQINKENETDGVNIKVIEKNVYMDYETYNIEVTNNTDNDILLDRKENVKSMYLEDSKGSKYSSYSHEIASVNLYVQQSQKRKLKIKYYSSYNSEKNITAVVFSDVVMEYKKENNTINKSSIEELRVNL